MRLHAPRVQIYYSTWSALKVKRRGQILRATNASGAMVQLQDVAQRPRPAPRQPRRCICRTRPLRDGDFFHLIDRRPKGAGLETALWDFALDNAVTCAQGGVRKSVPSPVRDFRRKRPLSRGGTDRRPESSPSPARGLPPPCPALAQQWQSPRPHTARRGLGSRASGLLALRLGGEDILLEIVVGDTGNAHAGLGLRGGNGLAGVFPEDAVGGVVQVPQFH